MRSRSTNLRAKVVALLLSLVALWAFAAWVTVRDGVNLLGVQAVDSQIVGPSEPLLLELQVERRLSTAQLGGGSPDRAKALAASRMKVDAAAARFRSTAQSWLAELVSSAEAESTVNAAIAALDTLPATRRSIDNRDLGREPAAQAYTDLIDSLFKLYDVVGGLDDREIEADTRHLIELYRIRELISQEDALLSGALAAGRITAPENVRFTELVAAQRFLTNRASGQLRPSDRALFDQVVAGQAFTKLRDLEDRILAGERGTSKLPVTTQEWNTSTESALTELQSMVLDAGDALVERATPIAVGVVVRLVLAAGLGLLAVIASIVVSVTTARALVAQLQRLRAAAHQLADERLPGVVERLGRGEKVDVDAEAPPLDFGDDEIGQVGQAFNRVQQTAIRTAVEQAELRRTVRDVFLSLARRTQALVHRQVSLLDAMERREQDAQELEDLFRVDHLAVRMRRNAENLVVLSGATPGRTWRRDVPMVDVVRGAVQEVEDYARVTVMPLGSVGLAGRAVGDVIHLLAELIENALSFSPPHTEVHVRGQAVARGFAIEIEDRGLGMDDEEFAAANEQIASNREFQLENANKLGLFVVSRLAARHRLGVHLKGSPYGGTTAVVLIPTELITNEESVATVPVATRQAATPTASPADPAQQDREPVLASGGPVAGTEAPAQSALTSPTPSLGVPAVRHDAPRPPASADATSGRTAPVQAASNSTPDLQPRESHTPGGLPVRVRQSSLAPQLRDSSGPTEDTTDSDLTRSPDHVRRMMASYQSGSLRGRADAERLRDEDGDAGADDSAAPGTER
ncbi:sensor histidine kinase [Micromonospora thermarum]|uniref:histidine kinase n=1 Tax=Micromonospora thermarum TaxID=2720024 RepID=A0ABX0Z590_9ACTN|nr:nitrate- and nitrite sensing domain-containing protein [Micromonospora thermarum]NJP32469.1 HAMP domain-containing protein [Micromonospora thermarum]